MLNVQEHVGHAPDWGSIQAKKCISEIKQAAKRSREPTATIIQEAIQNIDSETSQKLPKKESMKRLVRTVRRENLPSEPKTLDNLDEIPEEYRKNLQGDRWLLHYDPDDEEKMVVFATDEDLRYLFRSKYWIMDGTFKSSPAILLQLYTIHVNIKEQWFPTIFVLFQKKTKASYKALFQLLKRKISSILKRILNPKYISLDYEQAAINAVEEEFPNSIIAGCFFHLGQSFWRRLQAEGLSAEYALKENTEMRTQFRSLIAIAFVPVDDVEAAFDELQETVESDLITVFDYVEDNYIRGRKRGRRAQGRSPPLFPKDIWNCYERTLEGLPRTTNSCEGWHNRLNLLMGKSHPSFFHVVEQLRKESVEVGQEIERLQAGHSPVKKRKKYADIDKQIERIVGDYEIYKENNEILKYLRLIGHSLAGNF